jgi:hypothetical protein
MVRTFGPAPDGKLKMADDTAVTSHLASERNLGGLTSRDDLLYCPGSGPSRRALAIFCREAEMEISNRHSPGRVSEEGGRAPNCSPPGGVSEEGGSAPESWSRREARAADTGSVEFNPTEKRALLGWSNYWNTWRRRTKYAVIALDTAQAEQLMRYWQGRGHPQDTTTQDVRRVVAAAVRKGQGLLLTVEQATERQYSCWSDEKEELYHEAYREFLPRGWFG